MAVAIHINPDYPLHCKGVLNEIASTHSLDVSTVTVLHIIQISNRQWLHLEENSPCAADF